MQIYPTFSIFLQRLFVQIEKVKQGAQPTEFLPNMIPLA